jgi:hypothetical protein
MLEVNFFFSLVEVVRFFVIYDLARNKTGSVKDGMTELYKFSDNLFGIFKLFLPFQSI